ncbi:MAG: zf-HC2 domain-containing protein [Kofleriaceae bacterium]|nr:zf-HC2 domain-containing protein [Kofleriaceae bacterium]
MSCAAVQRELTAYLDGELDTASASALRGHLRLCPDCRAAAEDHAAIRDRLAELERPAPPPALWDGVRARLGVAVIADARRPRWARLLERLRPHLVPAGLAATACAVAVARHPAPAEGRRARPPAWSSASARHRRRRRAPGRTATALRATWRAAPRSEEGAWGADPAALGSGRSLPDARRATAGALRREAARLEARWRVTTAELLPLAGRGGGEPAHARAVASIARSPRCRPRCCAPRPVAIATAPGTRW